MAVGAKPQVLIVGAGPTGLMLALRLARHGVAFRIIDNDAGPGVASRAIAIHARTLEFYQQMGFADEVVARGIKLERIQLRRDRQTFVELRLGDMGQGLSPYPFMLAFPQDDHEQFFVAELRRLGIEVDWGTTLKDFTQDANGVRAVVSRSTGDETIECAYLCGCDGARSRVRQVLGLDFPGGTYGHLFYVADVMIPGATSADGMLNLGKDGFALVMPVRSRGSYRLVGIVPPDAQHQADLTFEHIRPTAEKLTGSRIETVNWFSTYHVHHRVAEKFRVGRSFILGDAGHVHSPAGGQGMNTGIGDAINLSWKLADVLSGRAPDTLLDTFETERIAFARKLVASTDTAFQFMVGDGILGRLVRTWFVPNLVPLLTRSAAVRLAMFKTVSQIRISYRASALSSGTVGKLSGGDRLPWLKFDDGDNFAPLQSMRWQVHVYGDASTGFVAAVNALGLAAYCVPWTAAAGAAGFTRDASYLIRPDAHIALASSRADGEQIAAYARSRGIKFAADQLPV